MREGIVVDAEIIKQTVIVSVGSVLGAAEPVLVGSSYVARRKCDGGVLADDRAVKPAGFGATGSML